MKHTSRLAAVAALFLGAIQAHAQYVSYNFTDGTSDGWANAGFGSTPLSPVVGIGGVNYISVPAGSFQVANVAHGADGSPFYTTMQDAAANPAGFDISYTYYINTANIVGATFLQVGTFVNTGSGYYAQDYGSPNELTLTGAQLASGQIFTGTITVNMAAIGYSMPPADTFFRLGFIENTTSGATGVNVDFTDITVSPEPTSLALLGFAAPAFWMIRRRRSASR
jgi:hypothetical protein